MTARKNVPATAVLALLWLTGTASAAEIEFTLQDIATIRAYYGETANRQPGRGKGRQGLPPGVAKNLARGKALPPGIAMQHLPSDLSAQLPPVPQGYERIVIDGKILLLEIATRVIHDVLTDILD